MTVPVPTPIFRIFSLRNLEMVLRRNGFFAPNFEPEDGLSYHMIHNQEIQQNRRVHRIRCGGRDCGVDAVSSAQAIQKAKRTFMFSDGHGVVSLTRWFDDLSDLDQVDWDVVYQRYWADTEDDGDRKRRKQAEFLIREHCPLHLIHEIGVMNEDIRSQVEEIMARHDSETAPPVRVRSRWYY